MDFAGLALKNHFNLCLSPTFGGRLSSTFPCRSKYLSNKTSNNWHIRLAEGRSGLVGGQEGLTRSPPMGSTSPSGDFIRKMILSS